MIPKVDRELLILAGAAAAWCFLHSALIWIPVTAYLKDRLGDRFRFFRLFYNIFAGISLLPVLALEHSLSGDPFFRWEGFLRVPQALLVLTSLTLFLLGSRNYDSGEFLGIRQIRSGKSSVSGALGPLRTNGLLGVTRHPWYLGAILIVWARDLDPATALINVIASAYLAAGALLEEEKLLREFGDRYQEYRKSVPMLVPWKWILGGFRWFGS